MSDDKTSTQGHASDQQTLPSVVIKTDAFDDKERSKGHSRDTNAERKKSLRRSWRSASPVTKLTVLFTGVIAVATVLYCGFAGWQLYEIHGSSRDTHELALAAKGQSQGTETIAEAARAQAIASVNQVEKLQAGVEETHALAKQAERSADTAQRSLEISERPWVGVTSMILTDNIEVGKVLAGRFTALNAGRTPAVHVKTGLRFVVFCGALPARPHPDLTGSTPESTSMILPNGSIESGESKASQPMTEEFMDVLKTNSNCELYGFARVTYDDTFGRSHWRHACNFWQKGTPKLLLNCQVYNDGDEDYPDGKEPN